MFFPDPSWLDYAYFLIKHRPRCKNRYFSRGWGDDDAISAVRDRLDLFQSPSLPEIFWKSDWVVIDNVRVRDGAFYTPHYLKWLPREARTAHFRLMLPVCDDDRPPIYLHMATTAEAGYTHREQSVAIHLAARGIGTLMLEHPFQGARRPPEQATSKFDRVSDLILEGGVVVEESGMLLQWLASEGYQKLGICGISKGGHHAALVALLCGIDVALVTLVAPHGGIPVFTEGLFTSLIDWNALGVTALDNSVALQRLRELLTFTSIQCLPPLSKTSVAIVIAAPNDKVVPRYSFETYRRHWPHADFRWVRGGHVSSILNHRQTYIHALLDAMRKLSVSNSR